MTSSYFFAFMPGAEVKRAKMLMSFSPDPEPRAPYPPAGARASHVWRTSGLSRGSGREPTLAEILRQRGDSGVLAGSSENFLSRRVLAGSYCQINAASDPPDC